MTRDEAIVASLAGVSGLALAALYVFPPARWFGWDETWGSTSRADLARPPGPMERLRIRWAGRVADAVRDEFGATSVNSWYRNPELNDAIGGSPTSFHMTGLGMDLQPASGSSEDWARYLHTRTDLPLDEVIWYGHKSHVHISVAPGFAPGKREFLYAYDPGDGSTKYSTWTP